METDPEKQVPQLGPALITAGTMRLCEFDGCDREHYGRGLCRKHYQQAKYHADPVWREKRKAAARIRAKNRRNTSSPKQGQPDD